MKGATLPMPPSTGLSSIQFSWLEKGMQYKMLYGITSNCKNTISSSFLGFSSFSSSSPFSLCTGPFCLSSSSFWLYFFMFINRTHSILHDAHTSRMLHNDKLVFFYRLNLYVCVLFNVIWEIKIIKKEKHSVAIRNIPNGCPMWFKLFWDKWDKWSCYSINIQKVFCVLITIMAWDS